MLGQLLEIAEIGKNVHISEEYFEEKFLNLIQINHIFLNFQIDWVLGSEMLEVQKL